MPGGNPENSPRLSPKSHAKGYHAAIGALRRGENWYNNAAMTTRVQLPEKKYDGYIFDLDGTLADSMPLHYRAWRLALRKAGAPYEAFLPEEFYQCGGKSGEDVVRFVNAHYGLAMDPLVVSRDKRAAYLHLLATRGVAPIAETVEFARSLGPGAPVAIATGSLIEGARMTLKSAGIEDLFSIIVTPAEVQHGKPAPDLFLLAAKRLGVAPERCVVFEDAEPGIQAARAAGMDCVRVSTPPEYLSVDPV